VEVSITGLKRAASYQIPEAGSSDFYAANLKLGNPNFGNFLFFT